MGRAEFESKFSIADGNLVISNPVELYADDPNIFGDIFNVQIKVYYIIEILRKLHITIPFRIYVR